MIIAVSGLTGSGKNTLGEMIAKSLKMRVVCPTFKDLAKKEGISLMEFQKKAEKDPNIDLKFDELLKEQAKKGNCVVTTWLGPWMLDADVRILVYAPLEVRAKRIAKRDGMSVEEAKRHIRERDGNNRRRYLKVYGIDVYKTDIFDLRINNRGISPAKARDRALSFIRKKMGSKNKKGKW